MKDPAFNFYSDNFLSGTMFFTNEQVGKYIRLLCAQHLTGHLEEKHMIIICKSHDKDIWSKFIQDDAGKYYNERLEIEINKRKSYSESRSNNKKGKGLKKKKICKSYDNHMGIGIGNEIGIELNKYSLSFFDKKYISESSLKMFIKLLKSYSEDQIKKAIENGKIDSFWKDQFLSPLKLQTKDKAGVFYIDKFLNLIPKTNGKTQSNNSEYAARFQQA